jgi:hypothetical protein
MSDIADKIYAATGLTLNAEAAAKIGQMIQQARRDALEEAARWHDEETFWMIKGRQWAKAEEHRKHAAAIRALGEKE